ncbi:TPA: hypothetical protein ACYJE7_004841, partial [Salmonella enterica]|nr:hypothetical protein [Salmonella enterica]MEA1745448.1 hypothetical protein [Salmonella enterica subsp. enterica serovar Minnesota]HBW8887425.1 hypothetical protein [Klebsiella pneumoniae]
MAIAKYMQIRKIQNAFGIFQKSVDSLLCGEIKIGERIAQTITIAMVNLTLNLQSKCNKKRSTHQLEYNFVSTQKP